MMKTGKGKVPFFESPIHGVKGGKTKVLFRKVLGFTSGFEDKAADDELAFDEL